VLIHHKPCNFFGKQGQNKQIHDISSSSSDFRFTEKYKYKYLKINLYFS
jgi:hypothetical protein